jgi:2-iminobutanoate/2-iminopropanoate deaminase
MGYILQEAGCGYDNVVKTDILLANITDFALVNDIYQMYFKSNFPARVTYQVAALPKNALVEIDAIAVVGDLVDVS